MAKPRAVAHAVAAKKRMPSLRKATSRPYPESQKHTDPNQAKEHQQRQPQPPVKMINADQRRQEKISDLTDPPEQHRQNPPIPQIEPAQQSAASSLTHPSEFAKFASATGAHSSESIMKEAKEMAKDVQPDSKLIFPVTPGGYERKRKPSIHQQHQPPQQQQAMIRCFDPVPSTDAASVVFSTANKSVSTARSSQIRSKLGFNAVKALLTRVQHRTSPTKRRQQTSVTVPGIPVVLANTVDHATIVSATASFRDEPALEPPELTETYSSSSNPPSPNFERSPPSPVPRPEPSPRLAVVPPPLKRAESPELCRRSDSPELRGKSTATHHHRHLWTGPLEPDAAASVTGRVPVDAPEVVVATVPSGPSPTHRYPLVVKGEDPFQPLNVVGIPVEAAVSTGPVDSDAVLRMEIEKQHKGSTGHYNPFENDDGGNAKKSTNPFDPSPSDETYTTDSDEAIEEGGTKKRVASGGDVGNSQHKKSTNPFESSTEEESDNDDPFEAILSPEKNAANAEHKQKSASEDEDGIPAPKAKNKKLSKPSPQLKRPTRKLVGPLVERFEAAGNMNNNKNSSATKVTKLKPRKHVPTEVALTNDSLISDLDQSLRHFPLKVVDNNEEDIVSDLDLTRDGAYDTITTKEELHVGEITIDVPTKSDNGALADSTTDTTMLHEATADAAMEALSESCPLSPFSILLQQQNRPQTLQTDHNINLNKTVAETTPRISNEAKRSGLETGSTGKGYFGINRGRESFSVVERNDGFSSNEPSANLAFGRGQTVPDPEGDAAGGRSLKSSQAETEFTDKYSVLESKTSKSLFQRILSFGNRSLGMSPTSRQDLDKQLDGIRSDAKTILQKSIRKAELESRTKAERQQYPEPLRNLDWSLRNDFRSLGMNSILSMQTLLDVSEGQDKPAKLKNVFKKLRESKASPSHATEFDLETASDIIKQMHDFSASVKEAAKRSKEQAETEGAKQPLWTQELVDLTGIDAYNALDDEEALWLFDVNPDAPMSELESIMEFAAKRLGVPKEPEKVGEILSPFAALRNEGQNTVQTKIIPSAEEFDDMLYTACETTEKMVCVAQDTTQTIQLQTIQNSFSSTSETRADKYRVEDNLDKYQELLEDTDFAEKLDDMAYYNLAGRDEANVEACTADNQSEISSSDDLSVILKKIKRDIKDDHSRDERRKSKQTSKTSTSNPERRDFLDFIFEATEGWLCGTKGNDAYGHSPVKTSSSVNYAWNDGDVPVPHTVTGNRTDEESFKTQHFLYPLPPKRDSTKESSPSSNSTSGVQQLDVGLDHQNPSEEMASKHGKVGETYPLDKNVQLHETRKVELSPSSRETEKITPTNTTTDVDQVASRTLHATAPEDMQVKTGRTSQSMKEIRSTPFPDESHSCTQAGEPRYACEKGPSTSPEVGQAPPAQRETQACASPPDCPTENENADIRVVQKERKTLSSNPFSSEKLSLFRAACLNNEKTPPSTKKTTSDSHGIESTEEMNAKSTSNVSFREKAKDENVAALKSPAISNQASERPVVAGSDLTYLHLEANSRTTYTLEGDLPAMRKPQRPKPEQQTYFSKGSNANTGQYQNNCENETTSCLETEEASTPTKRHQSFLGSNFQDARNHSTKANSGVLNVVQESEDSPSRIDIGSNRSISQTSGNTISGRENTAGPGYTHAYQSSETTSSSATAMQKPDGPKPEQLLVTATHENQQWPPTPERMNRMISSSTPSFRTVEHKTSGTSSLPPKPDSPINPPLHPELLGNYKFRGTKPLLHSASDCEDCPNDSLLGIEQKSFPSIEIPTKADFCVGSGMAESSKTEQAQSDTAAEEETCDFLGVVQLELDASISEQPSATTQQKIRAASSKMLVMQSSPPKPDFEIIGTSELVRSTGELAPQKAEMEEAGDVIDSDCVTTNIVSTPIPPTLRKIVAEDSPSSQTCSYAPTGDKHTIESNANVVSEQIAGIPSGDSMSYLDNVVDVASIAKVNTETSNPRDDTSMSTTSESARNVVEAYLASLDQSLSIMDLSIGTQEPRKSNRSRMMETTTHSAKDSSLAYKSTEAALPEIKMKESPLPTSLDTDEYAPLASSQTDLSCIASTDAQSDQAASTSNSFRMMETTGQSAKDCSLAYKSTEAALTVIEKKASPLQTSLDTDEYAPLASSQTDLSGIASKDAQSDQAVSPSAAEPKGGINSSMKTFVHGDMYGSDLDRTVTFEKGNTDVSTENKGSIPYLGNVIEPVVVEHDFCFSSQKESWQAASADKPSFVNVARQRFNGAPPLPSNVKFLSPKQEIHDEESNRKPPLRPVGSHLGLTSPDRESCNSPVSQRDHLRSTEEEFSKEVQDTRRLCLLDSIETTRASYDVGYSEERKKPVQRQCHEDVLKRWKPLEASIHGQSAEEVLSTSIPHAKHEVRHEESAKGSQSTAHSRPGGQLAAETEHTFVDEHKEECWIATNQHHHEREIPEVLHLEDIVYGGDYLPSGLSVEETNSLLATMSDYDELTKVHRVREKNNPLDEDPEAGQKIGKQSPVYEHQRDDEEDNQPMQTDNNLSSSKHDAEVHEQEAVGSRGAASLVGISSDSLYRPVGIARQITEHGSVGEHLEKTENNGRPGRQEDSGGSVIDLALTSSGDGIHPETPIIIDEFEFDNSCSTEAQQFLESPSRSTSFPQIAPGTPVVPVLDAAESDIAFSLSPSTAASSPQKQLHSRRLSLKHVEGGIEEENEVFDVTSIENSESEGSTDLSGRNVDSQKHGATVHIPNEISIQSQETVRQEDRTQTGDPPKENVFNTDQKQSELEKTLVILDEEFSEAGESSASLLLALTRSDTESQVDEESINFEEDFKQSPNANERDHQTRLYKARALLLQKQRSASLQPLQVSPSKPISHEPKKSLSPLRRALLRHSKRRLSIDISSDNGSRAVVMKQKSFDSVSPKSSLSRISPLRASLERRLQRRNSLASGASTVTVEPLDAEILYAKYSSIDRQNGVIDVTVLHTRDSAENKNTDSVNGESSDSTNLVDNENAIPLHEDTEGLGLGIQTFEAIGNVVDRLNINTNVESHSDEETIRSSNTTEKKQSDADSWDAKSRDTTASPESLHNGSKANRVLDSVMDRLRLDDERKESDAESFDLDDLFQRYDNIVKHLVVLDDERLARAQAKQMASIIHAADSAVLDDAHNANTTTSPVRPKSPARALTEIARRLRKNSISPRLRLFGSRSPSNKETSTDKILAARSEERPGILRSASFGSVSLHRSDSASSDNTYPSGQARQLRKQLEQALETSAHIRSTHDELGEDILSAQSLMQQRRSISPERSRSTPNSPFSSRNGPQTIGSPFSQQTCSKSFYHRNCCSSSSSDGTLPRVIMAPSTDDEEINYRHLESIRSGLRSRDSKSKRDNSPRRRRKSKR